MFLFPVSRTIFSQMLQSWTDIYSSHLFSHISYFVVFKNLFSNLVALLLKIFSLINF